MSQVVLVTGGSSGIGKAICELLTSQGYIVYGTSRNPSAVQADFNYEMLSLDVTDPDSIQYVVSEIHRREGRLDVLVNNAGIGITGPIEETPVEEMQRAFGTNFFGPIHMMKAVLPIMRDQKRGTIVNITSIAGYMGLPYRGVYSATKGALALVAETLQMEVHSFGIHICNIAPGDFNTDIASRRYHAPVQPQSPYGKNYQQVLDVVNSQMSDSGDPAEVAAMVLSILRKKNPKLHYKVGAFMEKASVRLKQMLPEKVFKKLLLNHYKI